MYISVSESDDLSSTKGSQGIKAEKYELATHTVKVRRTGALADVQAIWDLPGRLTYRQYGTSQVGASHPH